MSWATEVLLQHESRISVATDLSLLTGLLRRCEICGAIFDPLEWRFVEAYKAGNALISNHAPEVEVFGGDRRAMTDAIKQAVDEAPTSCRCY